MQHSMESFKRRNWTFDGEEGRGHSMESFKKILDIRWKVSKERMGHSTESLKRQNGTLNGKFKRNNGTFPDISYQVRKGQTQVNQLKQTK